MFKHPKPLTKAIFSTFIFTILFLFIVTDLAKMGTVVALLALSVLLLDGIFLFVLAMTSFIQLVQFLFKAKEGYFIRRIFNFMFSMIIFLATFILVVFVLLGSLIILLPFTA